MAKKSLKSPSLLAPGARRDFFTFMQDAALHAGDLSIAELARRIGYSHQAVYLALAGPRVPSWRITEALITALELSGDRTRPIWQRAVAEQRASNSRQQPAASSKSTESTRTSIRTDATKPPLTPRETQIVRAWLTADNNDAVLAAFDIRKSSLHSCLRSIRDKYAAVGRPAPTKTLMLVRALQDGLLQLHDFDNRHTA